MRKWFMSQSPHRYEVERMRVRASAFLELAREALRTENHDVSCFLSEQAAQLHLKSVLLEAIGDYPRTHSVRNLLTEVSESYGGHGIDEFVRRNRTRLIALEDAYIIARYTPATYTRDDARDMIQMAEEIIGVTGKGSEK